MVEAVYGGALGQWLSLAPAPPPSRGCRIISGVVWWRLVWWPWRQYIAALSIGLDAIPPYLSYLGSSGMYFTDPASLQGVQSPGDFAIRLSLYPSAHTECQLYGCVIIEFDVPNLPNAQFQPGLTAGGAREWWLPMNLPLEESMKVTYVYTAIGRQSSGPKHFPIFL